MVTAWPCAANFARVPPQSSSASSGCAVIASTFTSGSVSRREGKAHRIGVATVRLERTRNLHGTPGLRRLDRRQGQRQGVQVVTSARLRLQAALDTGAPMVEIVVMARRPD